MGFWKNLFKRKKTIKEPVALPKPPEEDLHTHTIEDLVKDRLTALHTKVRDAHQKNQGPLGGKQILDLVTSIEPVLRELDAVLLEIDPNQEDPIFEEARMSRDEIKDLVSKLLERVKDLH